MTPLWHVSAEQIVRQLQGTDRFGALINDLISARAGLANVPMTDLRLTVRQEVPDGGVDAAVDARFTGGPSEYFDVKTVWQYKARDFSSAFKQPANWECPTGETGGMAGLHYEVAKDYSAALIKAGYGYRLCVCDSMPAKTKSQWTKTLQQATKFVNPSSPDSIVMTADDIAPWLNQFPSICVKYFWPHLSSIDFQSFEGWGRDATAFVRDFVPVTAWETSMASLAEFCDLGAKPPATSVSAFQGEAGVGKTRLVYEAIRRKPAAIPLVLYTTSQEQATELAKHLSRASESYGIIVADECGLSARVEIEKILAPHRHRARAICIDVSVA